MQALIICKIKKKPTAIQSELLLSAWITKMVYRTIYTLKGSLRSWLAALSIGPVWADLNHCPNSMNLSSPISDEFKWDFGCRSAWGKWHLSRKCSLFWSMFSGANLQKSFPTCYLLFRTSFLTKVCLSVILDYFWKK